MLDRFVAMNIIDGLQDLKHGRFSPKSILELNDDD